MKRIAVIFISSILVSCTNEIVTYGFHVPKGEDNPIIFTALKGEKKQNLDINFCVYGGFLENFKNLNTNLNERTFKLVREVRDEFDNNPINTVLNADLTNFLTDDKFIVKKVKNGFDEKYDYQFSYDDAFNISELPYNNGTIVYKFGLYDATHNIIEPIIGYATNYAFVNYSKEDSIVIFS